MHPYTLLLAPCQAFKMLYMFMQAYNTIFYYLAWIIVLNPVNDYVEKLTKLYILVLLITCKLVNYAISV